MIYLETSRTDYYPKNIANYNTQVHLLQTFLAQGKSTSYHQMDL